MLRDYLADLGFALHVVLLVAYKPIVSTQVLISSVLLRMFCCFGSVVWCTCLVCLL